MPSGSSLTESFAARMLFAWGARRSFIGAANYQGELGVLDDADHLTPYPNFVPFGWVGLLELVPEDGVVRLATSGATAMSLTQGFIAWVGANGNGEGGDSTFINYDDGTFRGQGGDGGGNRNIPFNGAVDISAGGEPNASGTLGSAMFAVDNVGDVWAWGHNVYGQFGWGTSGTLDRYNEPQKVWNHATRGAAALRVHAGGRHCLVLDSAGRVWSAGENSSGQLARNSFSDDTNWGLVAMPPGGLSYTDIAAGPRASLMIASDGTVWGSGEGLWRQLGSGTSSFVSAPIQVSGISNVVEVMQQGKTSWFRTVDGTLYVHGTFTENGSTFAPLTDHTGTQRNDSSLGPVQVRLDWASYSPAVPNNPQTLLCSRLVYVSGFCDYSDFGFFPHYAVVGSDGHLYSWAPDNGLASYGNGTQAAPANPTFFTRGTILSATTVPCMGLGANYAIVDGAITVMHFPLRTDVDAKVTRIFGGAFPTDWDQPGFDDSGWTAPVLITPSDPALVETSGAALAFNSPHEHMGQPVWETASESSTDARMLIRVHFTLPAESYDTVPGVFKVPMSNRYPLGTWAGSFRWEGQLGDNAPPFVTGPIGIMRYNGVQVTFGGNQIALLPGADNVWAIDVGPTTGPGPLPTWISHDIWVAGFSAVQVDFVTPPGAVFGVRSYAQVIG